jgi:hypothetical protein
VRHVVAAAEGEAPTRPVGHGPRDRATHRAGTDFTNLVFGRKVFGQILFPSFGQKIPSKSSTYKLVHSTNMLKNLAFNEF